MKQEFNKKDRVTIFRRVIQPGAGLRWIKMIEDGLVLDRRVGHRCDWIQVIAPDSLDGVPINRGIDVAEWFPVEAAMLRVVRT